MARHGISAFVLALSLSGASLFLRADEGSCQLILSLETHNDFYCCADKAMHMDMGKAGRIVLAKEGKLFGDASNGNHGIEDPLAYGLGRMAELHLRLVSNAGNPSAVVPLLAAFFSEVREISWFREQWTGLRGSGWLSRIRPGVQRQILERLDEYLDPGNKRHPEVMEKLMALEGPDEAKALMDTFYFFGSMVLYEYNNKIRFEYDAPCPLESIDGEVLFGDVREAEAQALRKRLLVDLRNEFMALNIARLMATALQKGLSLVVIVGEHHGQGLKSLLRSRLDPKVPIRIRDSRKAFKGLWESSTAADSVGVLLDHFGHCQPSRWGFAHMLAAAERNGKLMLLDETQRKIGLVECPRTLTLEQLADCGGLLPGSELPEEELQGAAETWYRERDIEDLLTGMAWSCVIL